MGRISAANVVRDGNIVITQQIRNISQAICPDDYGTP
jgi:hypothetical protein